ncbi:MAG TPA: hypothetical protein VEK56_01315 [Vicinamibacterales bacterium]|nr:hypothetical protein [Vicinamibacterales bacterium]
MLAEIRYILYLMTFFAWVPLGAMAFGARGSRRRVKSLSALTALSLLACVYVLYMDFIWSKRVIAPIRVDLLLLIPLSSGLYLAMGAWGLNVWRTSHSRLMLVSSVFLVLPAAFLFVAFWYSMWSSNKTAAKIDSIPALLFDAQFKNAENFERTFGDISGTPVAGHYQSEPGAWPLASSSMLEDMSGCTSTAATASVCTPKQRSRVAPRPCRAQSPSTAMLALFTTVKLRQSVTVVLRLLFKRHETERSTLTSLP